MPGQVKLPFKPRLKAPQRRALIEQAAATLFAQRGYDATSLDDIAAAVGVTKRLLYDHFPAKSALHVSLLRSHTDRLLAAVADRPPHATSLAVLLDHAMDTFFRFVEEHPFAWRMLFRDPPTDPVVAQAHDEVQRRATAAIVDLLGSDPVLRARARTDGPEWLEMLAVQLKTGVNGLAGWWYEHADVPRARITRAGLDLAWRGLGTLSDG